ncbi:serine/threonine-protein kinase-like protein ACR4 [Actinidia eriantha]|uniref:serine/threonine-protein kinase-like protein ACR4 n=1 Tax=Actinidia eriantha TaxID=165200 RepID=UPI00258CADB1|nr:serine/threonine-protein kinase-like protein ACR4 [Actinidia eriantha]
MIHGEDIAYDAVMAILSLSLIILFLSLFFICKKKPIESKETIPTKLCACPYSLMEIDAVTDGFNPRRIVGQGRLGTVYVAVLPSGEVVGVKRIHPRLVLSNASLGFSSMLKWLSLAHHPNIVPILGFSEAPGERIVLMEFVGMMSLDYYLNQNPGHAPLLDWGPRLRIAAGVARGLEYLHEVVAPPIVHGCIKPSNVLIDTKFCARVCDYGLSFLAPRDRRGLEGYVDDEYWIEKSGTSKECDVYGFGVLLLEILSGRKSDSRLVVNWALPLIKEMKFSEFLDARLVIPSDLKPLVRLAKVALACVGNSRKNRPSMGQVAAILNNLEMELCF